MFAIKEKREKGVIFLLVRKKKIFLKLSRAGYCQYYGISKKVKTKEGEKFYLCKKCNYCSINCQKKDWGKLIGVNVKISIKINPALSLLSIGMRKWL